MPPYVLKISALRVTVKARLLPLSVMVGMLVKMVVWLLPQMV